MEQWKKRELAIGVDLPATGRPDEYEDGTPEQAFAEFMLYWSTRNYRKMTVLIVDSFDRLINTRAREIRQEFGHIEPRTFSLLSIDDTAPAMTTIMALVTYRETDQENTTKLTVHLMYVNAENVATFRGEPNGRWKIHQRAFNPIIYPRLTETA